ncbi:MAG: hypothetical protein JSS49_00050 [Planctomycetes bacterium]|nr:hypothetical protein [Planctomycetota bacterium]
MRSSRELQTSVNVTRMMEPHLASDAKPEIAQLFGDSIDRLYRAAMAIDDTPRSQLAYACFLAEHGQDFESLREFQDLLSSQQLMENRELLFETVQRFAGIQQRMIEGRIW